MENNHPLAGIKNGKKKITRYFLVDYENVQAHGLVGLSKLKSTDAVTVFYSDYADTLSFDLHIALNESRARVDFQKVSTGVKNALDFQLSSQLGYIINQNIVAGNRGVKFYIVSMDNGFSVLCDFWKGFDTEVSIVRSISSVVSQDNSVERLPTLEGLKLTESEEQYVIECIRKSSTSLELHNSLQKYFKDSRRAGEIYKVLKEQIVRRERESGTAKG